MNPALAMGQGSSLNANSSADMGADYSSKTFQGVTINQRSKGSDDTMKWVLVGLAIVVAAKVLKG